MSDLDNKLILEAMSRRGFLGTLGKAAAAASTLKPKLPIPDSDDDYDDDYDDYDAIDDFEGFDIHEWIDDNVLDHTIDKAIGDTKISNSLANKIQQMLSDEIGSQSHFSEDLFKIFDDEMWGETKRGLRFYQALEDPEFLEIVISGMSNLLINQFNLRQAITNAAVREKRGDRQDDILKDIQADINNPIEYSKFDTAGGKRDYEYTADSFMIDKDNKVLSEAYINEIAFNKNVDFNDDDDDYDDYDDYDDDEMIDQLMKYYFPQPGDDELEDDDESDDVDGEEGEESFKGIVKRKLKNRKF